LQSEFADDGSNQNRKALLNEKRRNCPVFSDRPNAIKYRIMTFFSTLTEALDDLRRRGFTADFDLHCDRLNCPAMQLELHPKDFEIVEVYRFEGATDPGDSSVAYAIESKDGLKGVLVDAYGAYADNISADMLAKLNVRHN